MKRSTISAVVSGALLAVTAGLLTAAPSQAAVSLPTGCSTQGYQPATAAEVHWLECTALSNDADLARYKNLTSLTIGSWDRGAPAVTLTKIPKLPAGLTDLQITAPKLKDVSSLYRLRKLQVLFVQGSTVPDLKYIAENTGLTWLSLNGPGYVGKDFSVLAKLSRLEHFYLSSHSSKVSKSDQGSWTSGGFSRGLDGKHLLPENRELNDDQGKMTGVMHYDFNATNGKIRYNSASRYNQRITENTAPKIKSMPKLSSYTVHLIRPVDVARLADWTKAKDDKLVVSGTRKVGSTLTARHKFSGGYADKFQWKRNGKVISGATGATYKLRTADRGHRISVTGTDAMPSWFGNMFRNIPYSQTVLVTKRL